MIFGVGFRLLLVGLALAIERIGTFLRANAFVETIKTLWPRDFGEDMERLRAALRRNA